MAFSFSASAMEDQDDSDSTGIPCLTLDDLRSWKVKALKEWLEQHSLKRSGTKDILVNRVYRAMQNLEDSDISSSNEDLADSEYKDITELEGEWIVIRSKPS